MRSQRKNIPCNKYFKTVMSILRFLGILNLSDRLFSADTG